MLDFFRPRGFHTGSYFKLFSGEKPSQDITDKIPVRSPKREVRSVQDPPPPPPSSSSVHEEFIGTPRSRVEISGIDKRFLVWSGQFKKLSDVPNNVEPDTIHKARTWGRIRINILTIGIAALTSIAVIAWAKANPLNRYQLTDEIQERRHKAREEEKAKGNKS